MCRTGDPAHPHTPHPTDRRSPFAACLPAGSVIRDLGLIEIAPDAAAAAPLPSGDSLALASSAAPAGSPLGSHGSSLSDGLQQERQPSPAPSSPLAGTPSSLPASLLVNVNNRLVPEETPLADGDYVVLARDRVRI